ncbi:hypothetical protein [Rufibacter tibetensis]|uniref:DUF998 domain-containing protein n=1 Tax=Rufibacter tibetensis TaxID=512763 RepID=A0A0P0CLA7_9BACT|nr:hypothetical protein [Rufibacter tibetensis]ALJ00403.1 hypothetical protein DC20_17270 [Rufibacter tibetensis]
MENTTPSSLDKALNLEYESASDVWVTNGYTLRKLIGIMGMSLPLLLWLYLFLENRLLSPLDSISHYFFTQAGTIFTIILSLLAIFLIVYKGEEPIDFYVSLAAGVFALLVLLVPTSNLCNVCGEEGLSYCVTVLEPSQAREIVHYFSAGLFLLCLAYMSFFLFTKSDKQPENRGKGKITRNRIYRLCGVIIVVSILVIGLGDGANLMDEEFYTRYHLTFWMEALAVEAFGLSWLIKGNTLFKDK